MDPAITSILIAVVTGLCTAIPTILTTIRANNVHEALQQEKINEINAKLDGLTAEVKKYNDFDKRLAILENIIFRRKE